jgi:hypothetical protein
MGEYNVILFYKDKSKNILGPFFMFNTEKFDQELRAAFIGKRITNFSEVFIRGGVDFSDPKFQDLR